ncbi:hypothetical protein HMPREF3162_00930 [Brevibacterium sp. HMSC07C04]|nr:hypothetical protein HMPREF3162_00930 [Brevibacterium sp. HMSC07C04]
MPLTVRIHVPSALAAARESTPAGPKVTAADGEDLVLEMRDAAETSFDLLLDAMCLSREVEDAARQRAASDRVLVVDRMGWVKANALMLTELLEHLDGPGSGTDGDRRTHSRGGLGTVLGAARQKLSSARSGAEARSAGVQLGTVLGILSRRVLGQYEPMRRPGALILNAPTILAMEQRLQLNSRDFRLWVAFHETTHRVQLALAPWIRGEVIDRIGRLLNTEESLGDLLAQLPAALRGEVSLAHAALSVEGQRAMEDITAIMTLLEGHADVMMDWAGKRVIPSVSRIRRVFDASRRSDTGLRAAAMRLIGSEEKLAQYEDGAQFVRTVIRQAGMDGFNRVWSSPSALPSSSELQHPESWVSRVVPDTPGTV